ncbi:MAG: transcriptional regulator GcvA [Pseudomonadales bacterium]|nr:transcriptional regulator GcvA [Pseudomonadales bacterium]
MPRRNYPMNALRVFEAAARNLSFVKASEELSVTAAAVSQQVKVLETYLGLALFRRQPKGLLLTDTGQLLRSELGEVFLSLDKALTRVLETETRGSLTLSVAPTFAMMWLIPRLQKFHVLYPEIDVRVSTGLGLVDFQRDEIDAAIRLGHGDWFGLEEVLLFEESVTPMCSPKLLEGEDAIRTASDLSKHVLLHNHSMDYDPEAPTWETWLTAAGVPGVDVNRGTHYSLPDHGLQASIDGAGVVLGWQVLAEKDVLAGRVVAPFDLSLPLGNSFYFVYPEAYSRRSSIVAFREWLLSELSEDQKMA